MFQEIAKNLSKQYLHFVSIIKTSWRDNSQLSEPCAAINQRRILYCAMIAIPVDISAIVLFSMMTAKNPAEEAWKNGILTGHAVIMILMVCFLVLSTRLLTGKSKKSLALPLQYAITFTLLTAGAIIAAVDQLVTTNITPYLLVCLVTGSVFLIRPFYASLLYLFSFALFCFLTGGFSASAVSLSNHVNGLAAIAIGFALSVIMWRHNASDVYQKKKILSQQKELERMNEELKHLAFSDSLTNLPNRRYFDEAVEKEIASMQRKGHISSIVELDLDHFKSINDTYGHYVGDAILQQVASLIQEGIRKSDSLCRYGGEEFFLLLPEASLESARAVAEKLRTQIEDHSFLAGTEQIHMTASFGVVQLSSSDGMHSGNYYMKVDDALYQAKQNGRNRVEMTA